jgi:hypothetical protein
MTTKPVYACCENPDPAILEKNGRLFCRSCRAYLDKPTDGSRPKEVTEEKPK